MSHSEHGFAPANITVTRRSNLLVLLREFKQQHLRAGGELQAVEREFAHALQIHPSLLSHIKVRRPISDKVARQIETCLDRAPGWLDQPRQLEVATAPGEDAFIELARKAWRSSNAKGKRELRSQLLAHLGQQPKK